MIRDKLVLVAIYLITATGLRWLAPNRLTNTLFAAVLVASGIFIIRHHSHDIERAWARGTDQVLSIAGIERKWPPRVNHRYPNLVLKDQHGQTTNLADFRGKVVLIEFVATGDTASVSLSGGQNWGPFEGTNPQGNLDSIRKYAEDYGHVNWKNKDFAFIQILLFDNKMAMPTSADAARWARHFGSKRTPNRAILVADENLSVAANRDLVPGFHLLDHDFVLRADSTGQSPAHDLYRELLPLLGKILNGE